MGYHMGGVEDAKAGRKHYHMGCAGSEHQRYEPPPSLNSMQLLIETWQTTWFTWSTTSNPGRPSTLVAQKTPRDCGSFPKS